MNKDNIIDHFKSGIKEPINSKIGVEHEKFLFYKKNNKRINYSTIKDIFKIFVRKVKQAFLQWLLKS